MIEKNKENKLFDAIGLSKSQLCCCKEYNMEATNFILILSLLEHGNNPRKMKTTFGILVETQREDKVYCFKIPLHRSSYIV